MLYWERECSFHLINLSIHLPTTSSLLLNSVRRAFHSQPTIMINQTRNDCFYPLSMKKLQKTEKFGYLHQEDACERHDSFSRTQSTNQGWCSCVYFTSEHNTLQKVWDFSDHFLHIHHLCDTIQRSMNSSRWGIRVW